MNVVFVELAIFDVFYFLLLIRRGIQSKTFQRKRDRCANTRI